MRIRQTGEVVEILCDAVGRTEASAPTGCRKRPDFHTSNIQRALTERYVFFVVRSGNPILRSPEGRSLTAGVTITRKM